MLAYSLKADSCGLIRNLNHCISVFLNSKCHKFVSKGDCLSHTCAFVWLAEYDTGQVWKTFRIA